MPHITLKGFVIREVPVGDADRIINIFTAELGLISASARGARRTRSPLLLPTQVFSFSMFELFAHKGHYAVNSAELIESFMKLHKEIDRLICAAHLAEVLLDSTRDAVPQPELYRLWAYSLQALQSQVDPLLLVHLAQMRFMADIGYSPCLDSCVVCGKILSDASVFSVRSCGTVCQAKACAEAAPDILPLTAGVLACLRHCLAAPPGRLFNARLSSEARQSFIRLSAGYLTHQMEKSYTRLNMLSDLQQDDQS